MSKRRKKKPAPASTARSPAVPSADAPSGGSAPDWRGILSEPVALGLAVFIFLRPWRDGLTFPGFNAYFSALAIGLAALWCARAIVRGEPLRFPVPLALLGGFLASALLTSFATYSYDPTYRGLQHFSVYFLLFAIATNGLRSSRAVSIVIASIGVTWLFSAVWSVFHYFVMLPGMRQILIENPDVVQYYFQGISGDLKSRLEANRAFGTFLFPNALGAFFILGIPAILAACPGSVRALLNAKTGVTPQGPWRNWLTIASFFLFATFVLTVLYFANDFIGASRPGGEAPIRGAFRPFLFILPIALATGGAVAWFTHRGGPRRLGAVLAGVGAPAALASSLLALWLSYSRGAIIALAISALVTAWTMRRSRVRVRAAQATAAALLCAWLLWPAAGRAQDELDGYRLPEISESGIGYSQREFLETQASLSEIDIEGTRRSLGELANVDSLSERVTYWQVGLRMLADNPWTGVGLGNFKQAYMSYQFLGAGDVEAAHNDYLQYFCETGLAGGSLFLAFWVYFGVWGARRILGEEDAAARRWLAGLYAGALAFALHSLVDFNFQNPGIASLSFVAVGLFYARAGLAQPESSGIALRSKVASRAAVGAMIALTMITTACVARLYLFDLGITQGSFGWRLYYIGDRKTLAQQREVATRFFQELRPGPAAEQAEKSPPYLSLRAALMLIPDFVQLESIGEFRVKLPDNPNLMRRLAPGEAVPGDAYLYVTNPNRAFNLAAEYSEKRIEALEGWDELYPHDPELASEIFLWYDALFNFETNMAEKKRYAIEAEQWAKASTDRSPHIAWWWLYYAQAMWNRGRIESGPPRLAYYFKGLDLYRHAHELYPRKGLIAAKYAEALKGLGGALKDAGRVDEGERMLRDAQSMFERADLLARYNELVR